MNVLRGRMNTPTPAAITAAQTELTAADRELHASYKAGWTPERRDLLRRFRVAQEALRALTAEARRAFAAARGWKFSERKWVSDHPVIDHAEVYNSCRRTVAVVTHSYATREEIERYAAERRLAVEFLDWSWYYPGGCIAAVLTPGAAALAKFERRRRGPL